MKINSLKWIATIGVGVFVLSLGGQASAADEPAWQNLFDGKTLDGFTQRGGPAKYRVEDGQIVGTTVKTSENTFLCTNRRYTDFVLEYDFKVDPRLNSGVQVRSNSLAGYHNGRVHGYQIEIDPTDRAYTAGIYDEARRAWLVNLEFNEPARKAFKQNDWNHVRIEARGPMIRTWLNDVPAAELYDELTRTGFIGLQVHATGETDPLEVRWRNLRIKDYGDAWRSKPAGGLQLLGESGDLSEWRSQKQPDSEVSWTFQDGYLEVKPGSGSIVTKRPFGDCRLHVEFCVDENDKEGQGNGNSGVYIQQRYEVQILNSAGQPPTHDNCGAIYKTKAPDYNMALPAGEWQTYDIHFRAPRWNREGEKTENARMTVYHNGTRIHHWADAPMQTGAGQPETPDDLPLLLQDHGNKIRFRNIWIQKQVWP